MLESGEGLSTSFLARFLTRVFIHPCTRESMCVRITGALKTFGNKRYINVTHLRVASDPHEQYFHILESIAVTLMAERGQVSPVQSLPSTMLT
jgi:hypothetical protein